MRGAGKCSILARRSHAFSFLSMSLQSSGQFFFLYELCFPCKRRVEQTPEEHSGQLHEAQGCEKDARKMRGR